LPIRQNKAKVDLKFRGDRVKLWKWVVCIIWGR